MRKGLCHILFVFSFVMIFCVTSSADTMGTYYSLYGSSGPPGGTYYFSENPEVVLQPNQWNPVGLPGSSMGLNLKNGSNVVFDNMGIEAGIAPVDFWKATGPGMIDRGLSLYSMPETKILAGGFHLDSDIIVTSLTGYFTTQMRSSSSQFDPNDSVAWFQMNIFSEAMDGSPTNTHSLVGNVFSSNSTPGTFSWTDTGYSYYGKFGTFDIYQLTYALNAPITLEAGDYFFSHSASFGPVPGPSVVPVPKAGQAGIVLLLLFVGSKMIRFKKLATSR